MTPSTNLYSRFTDRLEAFCRSMGGSFDRDWHECRIPSRADRKTFRRISDFMDRLEAELEREGDIGPVVIHFTFDGAYFSYRIDSLRSPRLMSLEKALPEDLQDFIITHTDSWTWYLIRDRVSKELRPGCYITDNYLLFCTSKTASPRKGILRLFETVREQMPVAEDLIKAEIEKLKEKSGT